ncbi:hypothetical protein BDV33DRAFT_181927, partial [Aspergillus novoparasiticus]
MAPSGTDVQDCFGQQWGWIIIFMLLATTKYAIKSLTDDQTLKNVTCHSCHAKNAHRSSISIDFPSTVKPTY